MNLYRIIFTLLVIFLANTSVAEDYHCDDGRFGEGYALEVIEFTPKHKQATLIKKTKKMAQVIGTFDLDRTSKGSKFSRFSGSTAYDKFQLKVSTPNSKGQRLAVIRYVNNDSKTRVPARANMLCILD